MQNYESVVFYSLKDHGHTWPGGKNLLPEQISGKNVTKLNANDIIWDFFEKHSLPRQNNSDDQRDSEKSSK
jgi:polyhydroxybutyrate depolymerase